VFTFLIQIFKTKDFGHLFKTAGLAFLAIGISAGTFAVILLPTQEYAKETMRGGQKRAYAWCKKR
jgi:hypothetical protein